MKMGVVQAINLSAVGLLLAAGLSRLQLGGRAVDELEGLEMRANQWAHIISSLDALQEPQ